MCLPGSEFSSLMVPQEPPRVASEVEEDPIESTGCAAENDAVLLCYDKHRDWRRCRTEMEAFKTCFDKYQQKGRENPSGD